MTVTVCSVSQSATGKLSCVADNSRSVSSWPVIVTATACVGSEPSCTVYDAPSPSSSSTSSRSGVSTSPTRAPSLSVDVTSTSAVRPAYSGAAPDALSVSVTAGSATASSSSATRTVSVWPSSQFVASNTSGLGVGSTSVDSWPSTVTVTGADGSLVSVTWMSRDSPSGTATPVRSTEIPAVSLSRTVTATVSPSTPS